jgi:hypothetical protein
MLAHGERACGSCRMQLLLHAYFARARLPLHADVRLVPTLLHSLQRLIGGFIRRVTPPCPLGLGNSACLRPRFAHASGAYSLGRHLGSQFSCYERIFKVTRRNAECLRSHLGILRIFDCQLLRLAKVLYKGTLGCEQN